MEHKIEEEKAPKRDHENASAERAIWARLDNECHQ